MESNNKSLTIIGIIVVIVLIVGGLFWFMNMNEEETSQNQNTSQTTDTAETEQPEPTSDIVALASSTESLSTLVTAVQAAGLVETLQGEGPFTVLAPTNDAFSKLPEGTLDTLLEAENKEQLASILTYHVISGKVMSSDLTNGQEVTTVQGGTLTVEITDSGVYFVDATGAKAMVETPDVEATNGVVHIINGVLLPE